MGLKVAMVAPWAVKCGIYTYTKNLSEALAQLGVDVYIVRLPRFGWLTSEILQNCVVDKIPIGEIDLIHIQHEYGRYHNLEGGFYGALARIGKPTVTTMHVTGNFNIDPIIAQVSRKVIVHNEWCARRFGYPEKVAIIPHGCIKGEPMDKKEARKLLGIPENAKVVGYCGFISPNKGLETLIEAVIPLKDVALLIGGGWHVDVETQYIEGLKARSLELLKGRCMWTGYVPDERLPIIYGASDLIVYPSLYISESGALLMALGFGKAVIARNLPPTREKEQQKALITFNDVDDLTAKIKLLFEREDYRKRLEEEAKRYTMENSWIKIAEKHLKLYMEILK